VVVDVFPSPSPNTNPPDPMDGLSAAVVLVGLVLETPNTNPPDPIDDLFGKSVMDVLLVCLALSPPNMNPADPMDGLSAALLLVGLALPPPNTNPSDPVDNEAFPLVAPWKVKPLAPIEELDPGVALFTAVVESCTLSSNPGRMVSHAEHFFKASLFLIEHTSHFHSDSSTLNISPRDCCVVAQPSLLSLE